ncbi:MAG: PRC-barrel domain-containing protein [Thermoplasmata archaeon]
MKAFSDIKGKEVLSSDGRTMGKVEDFTYGKDFIITGIVTKMNKEVIEDLGEDKPLLTSLKLGINTEQVKAFSDKVVLHEPLDELYIRFKEVSDKEVISSIIGMNISGSQGREVGKVKDILLDTDTWGIPSLLVKVNKDIMETLDVDKPLLSKTKLSISMTYVTDIGDMVMLDTSAEEMNKVIQDESIRKL